MKEIVDLTVGQVRVFPTDTLPFADLRAPSSTKAIKDTFHFENVFADPIGAQITFNNGTFESKGKVVNILAFAIEQRRIQLQVRGHSAMADAFYSAVWDALPTAVKHAKRQGPQPLVKVEETTCVATLDIDFEELIAPQLLRFIMTEAKERLGTDFGVPKSIALKGLSFEVKYSAKDPSLEEHDVVLSNKLLTIEPRLATPMRERRFYTSSPTDSETHLALLQRLEKEVSASESKKQQSREVEKHPAKARRAISFED
jgi:hypothetical protein